VQPDVGREIVRLPRTAHAGTFTHQPAAAVDVTGPNSLACVTGSASLSVQTLSGTGRTSAGDGRIQSVCDATIATVLGETFAPAAADL